MEPIFVDSPVQDQLTYVVPIICADDVCEILLDKITVEGGDVEVMSEIHLIPGDVLKFVLADVEVDAEADTLDSGLSHAGDFAIVAIIDESLVTPESKYVRVEADKPGLVQINPELESVDGGFSQLEMILYCDACNCNCPSPYEKVELVSFYVGPRPRKKLLTDATTAGTGTTGSSDAPDAPTTGGKGD